MQIKQVLSSKQSGFTLVEALVAISVLIVGILSSFLLVNRVLYTMTNISDRLTASFLAQEGMELVRNIRDTNFLRIFNGGESIRWNNGLGEGVYEIESTATPETPNLIPLINEEFARVLKYDSNDKLFNYIHGDETTFRRIIKITNIDTPDPVNPGVMQRDEIRVEVIIKWRTKNTDYDLVVEDHLYNYLNFK